jgi:hypothetical protein
VWLGKTFLILPDSHASTEHNNDRADWVGKLLLDIKPDVFINLGDQFDLSSMSSYDKGKRSFQGRAYRKDIDVGLEFSERLWAPYKKAKKKKPYSVFLEGNHEFRLKRVLEMQPELEGTIGFKDFELDKYYDDIVEYKGDTPGVNELDEILFAHYFITGISGRPMGGEHPAFTLYSKMGMSAVCGHSHLFDYSTRTNINGRTVNGLVAGCYQDYVNQWAGNLGELWRPGISVLREVHKGDYNLEFIHINTLKKVYGK